MKLSQPQIKISIFGWCSILQALFFFICLTKNSQGKKIIKSGRVHDPDRRSGGLSRKVQVDLICCRLNIYVCVCACVCDLKIYLKVKLRFFTSCPNCFWTCQVN